MDDARSTTTAGRAVSRFGDAPSERWWRWCAGAFTAAGIVGLAFAPWFAFAAILTLAGCVLVGLPAVALLERWRPTTRPIRRYLLVGPLSVALVFGVAEWVVRSPGSEGLYLFMGLYALPVAALCGALAAGVAVHLPRRLVPPVAAVMGVVAFVGVPLAVWWAERPPAPDDYVIVNATPQIVETFGSPAGLAEAIAVAFDAAADEGRARLDQDTWIDVADGIVPQERFGDTEQWTRFRQPHQLPQDPRTGAPERRITVMVRELGDACVVVQADRTATYVDACRPALRER
ncbi:MAG: hypothetical protein JJT89_12565 [Nitriliruptoraceae bacterium]|nr:hypothetical protein [Nitriliruptoraceae bacterium]